MNPFTRHPKQQGITYIEHWRFAMGVACRLLNSVAAFVVHALFPFVSISPRLDLESTAAFIRERNDWITRAGASAGEHASRVPGPNWGQAAAADRLQVDYEQVRGA